MTSACGVKIWLYIINHSLMGSMSLPIYACIYCSAVHFEYALRGCWKGNLFHTTLQYGKCIYKCNNSLNLCFSPKYCKCGKGLTTANTVTK